ncbi:hypothetical protein FHS63_003614 [Azospirillum doebereinerae]
MELAADPKPAGVEALAVNAVAAAVLADGMPDDHIAAIVQGGDARGRLGIVGVGVDPELPADRVAARVVLLGVNAVQATVLADRGPGHHRLAARQYGHRRVCLNIRCVRIDARFI